MSTAPPTEAISSDHDRRIRSANPDGRRDTAGASARGFAKDSSAPATGRSSRKERPIDRRARRPGARGSRPARGKLIEHPPGGLSIQQEIPVLTARINGTRFSIDRNRATRLCIRRIPSESPNQPSLLALTRRPATFRPVAPDQLPHRVRNGVLEADRRGDRDVVGILAVLVGPLERESNHRPPASRLNCMPRAPIASIRSCSHGHARMYGIVSPKGVRNTLSYRGGTAVSLRRIQSTTLLYPRRGDEPVLLFAKTHGTVDVPKSMGVPSRRPDRGAATRSDAPASIPPSPACRGRPSRIRGRAASSPARRQIDRDSRLRRLDRGRRGRVSEADEVALLLLERPGDLVGLGNVGLDRGDHRPSGAPVDGTDPDEAVGDDQDRRHRRCPASATRSAGRIPVRAGVGEHAGDARAEGPRPSRTPRDPRPAPAEANRSAAGRRGTRDIRRRRCARGDVRRRARRSGAGAPAASARISADAPGGCTGPRARCSEARYAPIAGRPAPLIAPTQRLSTIQPAWTRETPDDQDPPRSAAATAATASGTDRTKARNHSSNGGNASVQQTACSTLKTATAANRRLERLVRSFDHLPA